MVFSSITFLYYFLPIFLLAYAILPFRNATALIASIIFYIWGEGFFVLVLMASVGINYIFGRYISDNSRSHHRSGLLFAGIAVNVILLFYFKYFGFLVSDVLGLDDFSPDSIPHLPLGISFFTFQSISYLIDVYRKDAKPATNILDLALYIMMFPQLIAGPIVRYSTVARQIRSREIHFTYIRHGLWFFTIGLTQKVLIANNAGAAADNIFSLAQQEIDFVLSFVGTTAYTLQIYFDFAGYSNMAIGLGFIMGFKFPRNFKYPYISQSITEFWRRWHISLSSWFRDYVYIPLGGNRHGPVRTYINLIIIFFLCGLWHGAAWTFIAWGMYHGILLVIERIGMGRLLLKLPGILRHIYTLTLVMIGWILFRAESIDQAGVMISKLLSFSPDIAGIQAIPIYATNEQLFFILLGIIAATPLIRKSLGKLDLLIGNLLKYITPNVSFWKSSIQIASIVTLLFVDSLYLASGTYNPFLYFRF